MATSVPDFSSFLLPSSGGGGMGGGQSNVIRANPNFGSNQYMSYPQQQSPYYPMQNNTVPGTGIPSSGYGSSNPGAPAPYMQELPSGQYTTPSVDPQLTSQYGQYLSSQIGQGISPFNLSATMPSTGQQLAPGTLTAPLNPIMQMLQQFFTTGQWPSSGGGQGGLPPGVAPMFQSQLQAMQIPEQQQLADIQEQFGARGALGSSEAANAFAQFGEQTTAQEQSMLYQDTMSALPGLESFGSTLQGLDQNAIQALYQQFYQTQPQYNPTLGAAGQLATTFPGVTDPKQSILGSVLGGAGSILDAIPGLGDLFKGSNTSPSGGTLNV